MPDTSQDAPIEVLHDIEYADAAPATLLDIVRRTDAERAPVLVHVHGGAWSSGSKDGRSRLVDAMAAAGWVGVAIDYRLAPGHTWPAQIVDVKRALAWVREHIARYGGDPAHVVLTGGSSGAHLAALAALTPGVAEWQPGFEDADTSVAGCAAFYGIYDLAGDDGDEYTVALRDFGLRGNVFAAEAPLEDLRAASPLHRVTAEAPDFFVLHGDRDSYVPVRQAEAFVARLRAVSGSSVTYREVTGSGHMFDEYGSQRARDAQRAVQEWLEQLCPRPHDRAGRLDPDPA